MIKSPSGKKYVGYTKQDPLIRFSQHIRAAETTKTRFYSAIQKYGKDKFTIEILDEFESQPEATSAEQFYIGWYQADNPEYGYNMTTGGTGGATRVGYKNTKEQREKSSKAQLGKPKRNPGMCGRYKKSKEHRKKISEIVSQHRWVHNQNGPKKIHKDELDDYLNNGWVKGRGSWMSRETKNKISNKLKKGK